jgi:hypothetical protein
LFLEEAVILEGSSASWQDLAPISDCKRRPQEIIEQLALRSLAGPAFGLDLSTLKEKEIYDKNEKITDYVFASRPVPGRGLGTANVRRYGDRDGLHWGSG